MLLARTFVLGLLIALCAAGGAAAKGEPPTAVEICGPSGCATVAALGDWNLPSWLSQTDDRVGPAPPAAFYTLGLQFSTRTTSPIAYYVPSAGLIKWKGSIAGLGESVWLHAAPDVALLLTRASAGLRPFARPRFSWAMVGSRWVKRPSSYAKLFGLQGAIVPDPAAPKPALQYETSDREAWFAAWSPYLERVSREWIRVQLGTRAATPWDMGETFVWVGRRADILKRDGEVITIPAFVAQLIRRGAPL